MKKNELITKMRRGVNRIGLQLKRKSPEILIAAGVVGSVASAVMACRATLKVSEIIEEANSNIECVHNTLAQNPSETTSYTEEDSKHDLTIIYVQTGVKLAKLYAPSVLLGALSLTSILTSHNILRKRNMTLAAICTAMDHSFKDYRKRVAERFGEEVEKEIRYNLQTKEIEENEIDPETGEVKTVKKTVQVVGEDVFKYSIYAKVFDELNPNFSKDPEQSLYFLRAQQTVFNDMLRARGHVFLNEVYDALGIPRTKAGQFVGWIYDPEDPNRDNYIDFGIYEIHKQEVHDFINGFERALWLDFNVDGPIIEDITRHQAF